MSTPRKIVLHSLYGYRAGLEQLVASWQQMGVKYVGVVGVDAVRIEDAIDEICVGDGSAPYFMLTTAHDADENLEDALDFAETLVLPEYAGDIAVVEF